ncbi:MAG: glycogen debranching enzyme, partial [Deltaproteobacteria bacterium]|nr:glycogen debranching enzyme [Deltaproteobacteria bacterium]
HNEANGEQNRDGANDNRSWNCGVEGPTNDNAIEGLRNKQVKNFFVLTLLAAGTPMLLMGDEVRRTQQGNNNAYCQDNEISWFDWGLVEKHADVHRFVKRLIAMRLQRDVSLKDPPLTLNQLLRQVRIEWHGVKLNMPDWGPDSHCIALTAWSLENRFIIHLMINAYWGNLEFEIPRVSELAGNDWRRLIDTSREAPDDIRPWDEAGVVREAVYPVQERSLVMLLTQTQNYENVLTS